MGAPVDGDDARLVNHLVKNNHIAGDLQNLIRVVIAGGEHAAGHAARDAAIPDAHVLPGIGVVQQIVGPLLLGPRFDWDAAVGRVHYQ